MKMKHVWVLSLLAALLMQLTLLQIRHPISALTLPAKSNGGNPSQLICSRSEDCQFTQGGNFIKFDLGIKTQLTKPPTLNLTVLGDFNNLNRAARFKTFSMSSIPSLRRIPTASTSRFQAQFFRSSALVERL
jgi:hypothetical protein